MVTEAVVIIITLVTNRTRIVVVVAVAAGVKTVVTIAKMTILDSEIKLKTITNHSTFKSLVSFLLVCQILCKMLGHLLNLLVITMAYTLGKLRLAF